MAFSLHSSLQGQVINRSCSRHRCSTSPAHLSSSSSRAVPRPISSRRAAGVQQSSTLGDVSLFSDSSLLGPSSGEATAASSKAAVKVEDVPLNSELGMDYSPLRGYLVAGDFRKADDETRALLIRMAGEGAVERGWVYFTEVAPIPVADLQTVDALWRAASNGRFGFSVQKEMWQQKGRSWQRFFKDIDWVQGANNVYRKWPAEFKYEVDAPKGHLPLTNALRGTQLFEALLKHPAFEKQQTGASIDERSKQVGLNTLKF